VASPSWSLELVVSPTAAVAHAAAHFAEHPSERLRFREHADPYCFSLELDDSPAEFAAQNAHALGESHLTGLHVPPRGPTHLVVTARPDGPGSRIEIVSRPGVNPTAIFLTILLVTILITPLAGVYSLLLLLTSSALWLVSASDSAARQSRLPQARAALEQAFAPLRRTGLPYREPAALPAP
jgi:hypothetical protein